MMVPALAALCIGFQSEKYNEGKTILSFCSEIICLGRMLQGRDKSF